MSNYKNIRTDESQVLIESWRSAGNFKRALSSYLEPNALFGESIKCFNPHVIIIEGFGIEEVEKALAFIKGSFAGAGGYLIEWGAFQ